MLNKQIFKRLTVVLVLPLLGLGWWFAENNVLFPGNEGVMCYETANSVSCSRTAELEKKAILQSGNGSVKLHGAWLITGLKHMVVVHPIPETKIIDGKFITLPSTKKGVEKFLQLPPSSKADTSYSSCFLTPHAGDSGMWSHRCYGYQGGDVSENFTFSSQDENLKFQAALSEIHFLDNENNKRRIWFTIFSIVTPVIAYFAFMAAFFLLTRVVRYVLYGRRLA